MTKYNYNHDTFNKENDISFYLLGAYMTDGCIQVNGKSSWIITLSSKDEDWLQLIREHICSEMKMCQGNQVKLLTITNKKIGEWFINWGCVPRKSTIVQLPQIPIKYMPDFLRGCWDGDGCISSYKNKNGKIIYSSYLCSASQIFLKEIALYLKEQKINCSICEINKKPCQINGRNIIPQNSHYRLCLGGKATHQLVELLYYPKHNLSMPRKLKKSNEVIIHYQNLA